MSEMKTLKFPGDTEPREIVDAKARAAISSLSEEIDALDPNNTFSTSTEINCKVIAHRGYHVAAAQNTIAAFKAAAIAGFSWIEIDIRKTKDGVYIISHDDSVTLYNGESAVAITIGSANYADIKNYTWDSAGAFKICTLQAVFNAMMVYHMSIICDLKTGSNADVLLLALRAGVIDKIMLSYSSPHAAVSAATLLKKYDNVPIRVIPTDYSGMLELADTVVNPIYCDINASNNTHIQTYMQIALSAGFPIIFSGCTTTNYDKWAVIAAGCMANDALNISYDDFIAMLSANYDISADIIPSVTSVGVEASSSTTFTAVSSVTEQGGYIYGYSEDPTIASIQQTAFGSSVAFSVTGISNGTTIIHLFNGCGGICNLPVTVATGASSGDNDKTNYTITNNLTNVSTNNSSSIVERGSSYTAKLTADDGYRLSIVTVTMGGVEQTVSNGEISISSVTGDIVVTATAIAYEANEYEPALSFLYGRTITSGVVQSKSNRMVAYSDAGETPLENNMSNDPAVYPFHIPVDATSVTVVCAGYYMGLSIYTLENGVYTRREDPGWRTLGGFTATDVANYASAGNAYLTAVIKSEKEGYLDSDSTVKSAGGTDGISIMFNI